MAKHDEREKEREKERDHRAHGGGLRNQEIDGEGPERAAKGGRTHETHGGHRMASGGHMMHNRGPHPGGAYARGGKTADDEGEPESERDDGKVNEYNAEGSPPMKAAKDEEPGFAKGGEAHKRKRRREGGHASGEMERERLDRRPRRAAGGRAGGHSPYSSASSMESPENSVAGRGFEGVSKNSMGTK